MINKVSLVNPFASNAYQKFCKPACPSFRGEEASGDTYQPCCSDSGDCLPRDTDGNIDLRRLTTEDRVLFSEQLDAEQIGRG